MHSACLARTLVATAPLVSAQHLRLFNPFPAHRQLHTLSNLTCSAPVNSTIMPRGVVLSLAHGGGPMPILGDPSQQAITDSFQQRVPSILRLNGPDRPAAIIVVTAHWSEDVPSISAGPNPALYYDYYNFPQAAYSLKYDAPGAPAIATDVARALTEAGFAPRLDTKRGWDHGVFVPMTLIHPAADIPIVQMSVLSSEDPAAHFALGRALAPLRERNIAILCSGSATFHNFAEIRRAMSGDPALRALSQRWSAALGDMVTAASVEERGKQLAKWRSIEGSYRMHPDGHAEHFLPLLVAAGAGGEGAAKWYNDELFGLEFFSYWWE